jgi:hypothetical protein
VPVNFDRLWSDPDPAYIVAVRALVDEVEETRVRLNAEEDAAMKLHG